MTPPGTSPPKRARVCHRPSGPGPPMPSNWLRRAVPPYLVWTSLSRRKILNLYPVYHGSVCPKLRLPAQICHCLPLPIATWPAGQTSRLLAPAASHPPHRSADAFDLARSAPTSRGFCVKALTVDRRPTTMLASKAHLPPWSPLRFSMRLQWDLCCDVQGCLHYSITMRRSQ